MTARPLSHSISAVVAIVFGLATVISGGSALFGEADMAAVVPFVLWFNFVAGFAYLLAGFGLWRGGAYESRTMAAMILRLGIWATIATVAAKIRWPR